MNRSLISLYVLLTSPMPVPWLHLAKGAAIVLVYTLALQFGHITGINPVNFAVLAGLLILVSQKLPLILSKGASPAVVVSIHLALCAVTLFTPASLLPYIVSIGLGAQAVMYGIFLLWDRPFLERMGWGEQAWGSAEGQANAVRITILRLGGHATANAYIAHSSTQSEWVVAYAALPVVFYALYHWTIIATHPFSEDA